VLDDNNDKTMARNQVIAIVLMSVLLIVWFQFFMPAPPPVQPDTPDEQAEQAPPAAGTAPEPSDAATAEAVEVEAGWPHLPPPPSADAVPDDIVLEDDDRRLVFTPVGGRLRAAYIKLYHYEDEELQIIPQPPLVDGVAPPDTDAIYPLGLEFSDEAIGRELDRRLFQAEKHADGKGVTFTIELPGAARISKSFRMAESPHLLDLEVRYANLEPEGTERRHGIDRTPAYWVTWGPGLATDDQRRGLQPSIVIHRDGHNETTAVAKLDPYTPKRIPDAEWIALKTAYFCVAVKPEHSDEEPIESAVVQAVASESAVMLGLGAPRFIVPSGGENVTSFRVYVGPTYKPYLAAAWPTLPSAKRFFEWESMWWMDRFAAGLLTLLNWFYSIIPSYGVAIIVLTVLVRMAMFPLTWKSMKSMKGMQALAPQMQEIKEKYGEDQQEMNKRVMELYRDHGVNPLGGCLPMLLQMPVFLALYRMLWSAYELRGAPFTLLSFGDYTWIRDLSQPDRLLHLSFLADAPFVGSALEYLNILPILMAIAMVVSQKLMPTSGPGQSEQQRIIMTVMPVMFAVICYNMASGLNLYILTSTVLGIAQNKLIPSAKLNEPPKKKATRPKKKQNFYTAAQARKRQMAKKTREDNSRKPSSAKRASKR